MQRLFEEAICHVQQSNFPDLAAMFPFLNSTSESLESLGILIKQLKLRDAYVIAL